MISFKVKTIAVLLCIFAVLLGVYIVVKFNKRSSASPESVINMEALSPLSSQTKDANISTFSLYSPLGYVYKTTASGPGAVVEFIQRNPQFTSQTQGGAVSVSVLPADFLANSYLTRYAKDNEDSFLKHANRVLQNEHFFYNQKMNDVPVYGAGIGVHIRNQNEVYATDGNVVLTTEVPSASISDDRAKEISLSRAKEDLKDKTVPLIVAKTEKYILNKKALGIDADGKNYTTIAVTVNSQTDPLILNAAYFVDLVSGSILHKEEYIQEVLNRVIYSCSGASCPQVRREGGAEVGDKDADGTYAYLGDTYNLYSQMFQRDSYDGAGAQLKGYVHITQGIPCPNAQWDGRQMKMCSGMAAKDVLAHELTHAVTGATARLTYQSQSGALNESVSDIFGYGVDDSNWTMGEDTVIGVLRYIDDPTKSPRTRQPDKLSSQYYYCGSQDNGGVHINSGVLNKTFYLMTAGGSFNGCTITGLGKEKSLSVTYRALTTYLRSNSNFKSAYTAFTQACDDLYKSDAGVCDQVKRSFQATEMDQQPATSQSSPKCTGAQIQAPACAGSAGDTPIPTATPTTGTPQPTATPTPGGTNPTSTPTPTKGQTQPTNTPTPLVSPTPTSLPNSVVLTLKLKFQGITGKVARSDLNTMKVRVTLAGTTQSARIEQYGNFTSGNNGIWTGRVDFPTIPAGNYKVFVKGPKHIQKKLCVTSPTETQPGSYRCRAGEMISLVKGNNALDFSGITFFVGDLPEQDGLVNSFDFSLIRNNLGAVNASVLSTADLNFDGIIDAQDYSLVITALSIRYDEEE
ncbi:MAG: M4 family metallopeptidase [bacterium]|nr:M4 family metallopeptidase [bacterium]